MICAGKIIEPSTIDANDDAERYYLHPQRQLVTLVRITFGETREQGRSNAVFPNPGSGSTKALWFFMHPRPTDHTFNSQFVSRFDGDRLTKDH